jgi:hypothetical protein
MKLDFEILPQTKLPPGFKPGAQLFKGVEATLNQHGIVVPVPGTNLEHLIPWARVLGVTRERQAAK